MSPLDALEFPTVSRPRDKTFWRQTRFRQVTECDMNGPPLRSGFHQGTFSVADREVLLAILSSSIDRDASEFRANAERMRALG